MIRKKRLTSKRERYINFLLTLKIIIIHYLVVGSLLWLISPTMAGFTDTETLVGTITANKNEKQWDESSLSFISEGGSCSTGIFAVIQNDGKHMKGTTTYIVYFNSNGSPNNWNIVGTGTVDEIKSGKTQELSFTNVKAGVYKFMVLQRPGYEGDSPELWGDEITITCN
jgi:YqxM protein